MYPPPSHIHYFLCIVAAFGPNLCTMLANACFCFNSDDRISLSNVFSSLLSAIGVYYAGIQLTAIDLSPNYAGTLMAIANSFGAVSNILMPYISTYVNNSVSSTFIAISNFHKFESIILSYLKLQDSWSCCIRTITWLFCIFFTSGDVQSFDSTAVNKFD